VNFQSSQAKQKQKKFPQNLIKSWDVTPEPTPATVAELDLGDGTVQGDKVTQGFPVATRQVSCSESGGRAVACDPPNPARPGVVVDSMQAVKQLDE
jgi:hypothetical protein